MGRWEKGGVATWRNEKRVGKETEALKRLEKACKFYGMNEHDVHSCTCVHFKARAPKRDLSCVSIVTIANIKHDKNFYFSLKFPHFYVL